MGLEFYDSDQVVMSDGDVFRTIHDGYLGGNYEFLFYIKNDDNTLYFTNINLNYVSTRYDGSGPFANSGWSVKFMYGQRQPTEAEWNSVRSGATLALPDIGISTAADISTYHPIWVRVHCPARTASQKREHQSLQISYLPRLVV